MRRAPAALAALALTGCGSSKLPPPAAEPAVSPPQAARPAGHVVRVGNAPEGVIADTATGLVAVMRQAVEAARMGWGLCTIAGVAGRGETLDVIPRLLITGRRICGSSFGGVKGRDQVPQLVQLYLDGQIDIDPFISHRLTLDTVNEGFELMERQDGIRSVISFD